jgi:hypothetical protein
MATGGDHTGYKAKSKTFLGSEYPKEVLELVHESTLEQSHRVFEANHAIILEEQKVIRK